MSSIAERVKEVIFPKFTQVQLAHEIGMKQDALSRALNGHRHFSNVELAEIAKVSKTSLYWLITGEIDPAQIRYSARHNFDNPGEMHSTGNDVEIMNKVNQVVSGSMKSSRASMDYRKRSADQLIQDFGAVDARTIIPWVENLGVVLVWHPGLSTDYYFESNFVPVILLKSTNQWYRAHWSIAHEIGHLFLGHRGSKPRKADEWPAHQFAADLLLPESFMRSKDWDNMTQRDVAMIVWNQGISTLALKKRLENLNITVSSQAREALGNTTPALVRKFAQDLPRGDFEENPILLAEGKFSGLHFPGNILSAYQEMVLEGDGDIELLAWARGVQPDELDIDWPESDGDVFNFNPRVMGLEV